MTSASVCVVRQEFIHTQTCFPGESLQHIGRSRVNAVRKVCDRRLAHSDALRKVGLFGLGTVQVVSKSFHMPDSIAIGYFDAIGSSYARVRHAFAMGKTKHRTVLDRAMEALGDKYPREKPTQIRLAHLAGVKQPSVNGWGEDGSYPSMPTAVKLAEALDVCVEWLLTERGPKFAQKSLQADQQLFPLISDWSKLKDEQRRQIVRYADFIKTEK